MNTQPIGPFLGLNNRLPDLALAIKDKGNWLREAENVEITNAGSIRRRAAAVLVQVMVGAHSLYLTTSLSGYLVRGGTIYAITLPTYSETLFKILTTNDPVCWTSYNGDLYYSNGTDSGRISAAGVWYPWALPTPLSPSCAVITGTLYAGHYQIGVSYYNNVTGEEGGISASSNPELTVDGGVRVTLPGATAGATHVNIYASTVNGSVPMLIASVDAGTATYDLTIEPVRGRESNGRFEKPLPAGTQIFMANGRLCSLSADTIYIGSPARPGYYIPVEGRSATDPSQSDYGFIQFPASVDLALPVPGGVYVAYGDITQFFVGEDFGNVQMVNDVLPYGAVPGTTFAVPHEVNTIFGWFGKLGVVLADKQGQVTQVMADTVDQTPPASGTSVVVQTRGYRRVVSCGWCVNLENRAVTHWSGWDVTSASRGYCVMPDGIYTLDGVGSVDAHIGLGKNNFGAENLKHLPACYLGVASETPMELRVTTPEDEDYRYEARSSGAEMRNQRIDPGKGLRANWYDLEIHNTEGSDFTLASVSFAPVASGRRI